MKANLRQRRPIERPRERHIEREQIQYAKDAFWSQLVARAAHDDEGFARNVIPVGAALGAPVGAGTAVLSSRVMAASAVLAAAMLVKAARLTSSPAPERSRS